MIKRVAMALLISTTLALTGVAITSNPAPKTHNVTIQYTVKSGDTLWDIAQQYHTTVRKLKFDSDWTRDDIIPGDILIIEIDEKYIDFN